MKKHKKIILSVVIVALIVAASLAWINYGHTTSKNQALTATNTAGVTGTKVSTNQPTTTSGSSNTTPTTSSQPTTTNPSVVGDLLAPTGSFVSNHHPNLSGSPAPNQEQSVCITTPGAACNIEFAMNGVTKSLGSKLADSGGNVYWTWTLQSVGLTQGNWQITAKASANSQTKSTTDSLSLDVQP